MSNYDAFLQFKKFSKKSKQLKFSITADLSKNIIFCIFTILQILQPNEEILVYVYFGSTVSNRPKHPLFEMDLSKAMK